MKTPTMSLSAPADVLATVSFSFGFEPSDSVVVLGLRAKRIVFQARMDLPDPDASAEEGIEVARRAAMIVVRQRVTRAIVIGYGSEESVTPMVNAMRTELSRHRINIPEMLRVTEGRYWSYVCTDKRCCDPAGMPFDVNRSPVAVPAIVAGMSVAPSRTDIEERLASLPADPGRDAAADAAGERLGEMLSGRTGQEATKALIAAGVSAVDTALARTADGGVLNDDEIAWLGLLLRNVAVRDYAWELNEHDLQWHVTLWTDVLRRVDPEHVAPPATLLAFAAWRLGDGAVCSIALNRALAADPSYRMARYLAQAVNVGMSPKEYLRASDRLSAMASPAGSAQVRVVPGPSPRPAWGPNRKRRPHRRV